MQSDGGLTAASIAAFQETVWQQGRAHYRTMPWRDEPTFYYVLVSELMLQQTQVTRVLQKFHDFIIRFPNETVLSQAPLSAVIQTWQGLGYNRRAKYLHDSAKQLVKTTPTTLSEIMTLPGVGKNTAGALMNYVYQQPTPFVETNIRTVYFYHFFSHAHDIPDNTVLELVRQTLDDEHPREWFWALMDYGAILKQQGSGSLSTSRHYKKQSPLKGSVREVRGQIITALSPHPLTEKTLRATVHADHRFGAALRSLVADQLITITPTRVQLADTPEKTV